MLPWTGHFDGSAFVKKCPGGIAPNHLEADGANHKLLRVVGRWIWITVKHCGASGKYTARFYAIVYSLSASVELQSAL